MNGLGLAGVELHGIIGYNVFCALPHAIDFTTDKIVWTPLDWGPTLPESVDRRRFVGSVWK